MPDIILPVIIIVIVVGAIDMGHHFYCQLKAARAEAKIKETKEEIGGLIQDRGKTSDQ